MASDMALDVERPVMRYHGGKFRLGPWIIKQFPPHERYIEPYGGAGSVLMRKPATSCDVYNDLDVEMVNVFRVLRDPERAEQLRRVCTLTPYSRSEYELCYEEAPAGDDVEAARRTIFRAYAAYGGCGERRYRTGMRPVLGGRGNRPDLDWRGWPASVPAFVDRLSTVHIECVDALALIKKYDRTDTLIYCDPPYVHSTRSMVSSAAHYHYRHEMKDAQHRALADVLNACASPVAVSGYDGPLYDELYAGWERRKHKTAINGGKSRMEVLWLKPAYTTRARPALAPGFSWGERSV